MTDLTRQRFGRWLVIGQAQERNQHGDVQWLCRCDCGSVQFIPTRHLGQGKTRGCRLRHIKPEGEITVLPSEILGRQELAALWRAIGHE